MKKILCILVILISAILHLKAGGLVTNSNQSASYYRMLARGASTTGDAVYYNPAGLAFLENGLTISLNSQTIWMTRTLTNDLSTFNSHLGKEQNNSVFTGKLFVPVFPGVYAAYKTGDWAFSLGFNPPAGGGSVEFANGLPMLEKDVSLIPTMLTSSQIPTTRYSMESMLKGSSIVYGVQAGVTYKIDDMFGLFGGVRMLFASNSYEGYLRNIRINPNLESIPGGILNGDMMNADDLNAKGDAINNIANSLPEPNATQLRAVAAGLKNVASNITDKSLDVSQKGKGIAPIIGLHFNYGSLNLAAKYEFRAKMTLTNETKKDDVNMYPDGQKLRSDVPALLSIAGSYDIVPALKLSVTYLHHFEPKATFESFSEGIIIQRQDLIYKGTNEYMAGLEWKLSKKLLLSTGCQSSNVNVYNAWQNDMTHHMDNFTLGLGGAYLINDRLTLNIGGIYTWYKTAKQMLIYDISSIYSLPANQTYDRVTKAFAIGLDYRF